MSRKRKGEIDVSGGSDLTTNPFAALAGTAGTAGTTASTGTTGTTGSTTEKLSPTESSKSVECSGKASSSTGDPPTAEDLKGVVVVRYQRKGRGGKEVTLIEKLDLEASEADTLCRKFKRTLGCGGHVEDGVVVLAGDQRERLPTLLQKHGACAVRVS